jgi:D-xylose transport system substrate-binding protein
MQQAITALGKTGFEGVYGANDEMAAGSIAAMKSAGVNPAEKPSTGQDATVAGVQRIIAGQQYMTVYKATDKETKVAAEIAVALVEGKEFPKSKITEEVDNGKTKVPSVLLEPVAVTKDNVKQTVVADEFITPDELCTGPYADACKEQGIS